MGSQEGDDFSAAFPMSQSTDFGESCEHLQLQKELQFHPQCQRHTARFTVILDSLI